MEDIPIVIGNEKIKTKDVRYQVMVRNIFVLFIIWSSIIQLTIKCKQILIIIQIKLSNWIQRKMKQYY